MSVLEIVMWPDTRLSTICEPIKAVTSEIEALAADMLETMYAAPGRGLAGPQVGVMQRIFVMDVTWKEGKAHPRVMLNPEIAELSETTSVNTEACLSIPGVSTDIARPDTVRMAWMGLDGVRQTQEFTGFAAVCAQHELDHLNGKVTLDHLSDEARAKVLSDYHGLPL